MRVSRYVRAFFKALSMTLRGEAIQPPDAEHPELHAWIMQGREMLDRAFAVAEKNGFDDALQEQTTLTIDHRPMAMRTVLKAVQHNLETEYPMLLASRIDGSILTIQSINMNDHYRVGRLLEHEAITNSPLETAVRHLHDHLGNIPSKQAKNQ
ncbi:MAG: hypothetical protein CL607_25645 [Anaerolineaceae bacterium]|nr:hypothetical protein [Anaerolineaceae bacterium]